MVTQEQLRTARTKFVYRWHAAQTIGECLGNDTVGERFEHINHAKSLDEYVWRYGAFEESADGTGRVPSRDTPYSLRDVVTPVAAKGRDHLFNAIWYALITAGHGRDVTGSYGSGTSVPVPTDRATLQRYAEQHPDIKSFASEIIALHHAMLRYYVQMRYLTPNEAERHRTGEIPLVTPLRGTSNGIPELLQSNVATVSTDDLTAALRGAFARNIYNALVARAQAELFETVVQHPEGRTIATVVMEQPSRDQYTTTAIVQQTRARFAIHDDALVAMIQSLDEEPVPPVIRWLYAFKTAVSAMITIMPVFIVKNFFRDTLSGFVAGRYWQLPFVSTLSGSVHAIQDLRTGRSEVMREYLLQGGFFSALVESEIHVEDQRTATAARVRGWVPRLAYVLTRPAWIAEAGTRVYQFQKARACGATNYAATRAARMVSCDFANIGASRAWRMYVHTVPFMNAAIQGFDQLYQIVRARARIHSSEPRWNKERRQHVRKTVLAGLCLSGMTLAVWLYNASDEARRAAYQSETQYEKASWLTLYDVVGDLDIRVPAPFQIGAMFMKVPEVAFDVTTGVESLAGWKFGWSLVHGNLAIGWIPAAAQPVVEVRTNRNFFGAEIIPAYMQNWLPEQQFFPRSTPLPYRAVGRLFGVSPLHVQTFVRGWTGHLGNAAVTSLDELMWDTRRFGPKPFPRTAGLLTGFSSLQPPPLRTFTRYSNEFYEISDWFNAAANAAPGQRPPSGIRRGANRVRNATAAARRVGDRIRTSPNLSRREKEQRLINVYQRIDARFQRVLPRMRRLYDRWR